MNLHVAGRTAEERTGSIFSNVIVGGWRLSVACTNAEAHLWDQGTSQAGKGAALGFICDKNVLVRLQRPEERR